MLTVAAFVCGVFATDEMTLASSFPLNDTPPQVAALLRSLDKSERTSADYARLFASLRLRPYLIDAVLGTDPPRDVSFREGYALHFNRLNAERVKGWRKEGRIDLIAEAGVVAARCRSDKADTMLPELCELIREVVGERLPAVLAKKLPGGADEAKEVAARMAGGQKSGFLHCFPAFGRRKEEPPFDAGRTVTYNVEPFGQRKNGDLWAAQSIEGRGCLADRIVFPKYTLHYGTAYVAADEFRGFDRTDLLRDLNQVLLVCNAPLQLAADRRAGSSIYSASAIVVDGDVELGEGPHLAAVVIARGDITMGGWLTHQQSLFVAGGQVIAETEGSGDSGVLLAKGGFEVGGKKHADGKAGVQLAGCGPADLSIRWFDVADVGLTVGANKWRPVVTGVGERSPFRGVLEPNDVLRSINGRPVRTEDEARRGLRRAVATGYAVVEFARGRDEQSRLIMLTDVIR